MPPAPWRTLGGLIRLVHPFPILLDGVATGAVAILAGGDYWIAVRLGLAMLALQASIGALNDLLDAPLDGVVQLVAVGAEKLDAIVVVRIVRGGDDDAGIGAQAASDVGNAGRWQRADEENIDAHRQDAGGDGVLQHVAGEARVLANDYAVPAAAAGFGIQVLEDVGRGTSELERGLSSDGFDVGGAAHPVGAEDFFGGLGAGSFRGLHTNKRFRGRQPA